MKYWRAELPYADFDGNNRPKKAGTIEVCYSILGKRPRALVTTAPQGAARLKHRSAQLPYADLDGNNRSTKSGTIETPHPSAVRPPLGQQTNRRSK